MELKMGTVVAVPSPERADVEIDGVVIEDVTCLSNAEPTADFGCWLAVLGNGRYLLIGMVGVGI